MSQRSNMSQQQQRATASMPGGAGGGSLGTRSADTSSKSPTAGQPSMAMSSKSANSLTSKGPSAMDPMEQGSMNPKSMGQNSMAKRTMGSNPLSQGSMGKGSMGQSSMGQGSMGQGSMGRGMPGSMGQGSMGRGSMGQGSMGQGSMGRGSMGQGSMAQSSMGQGSMGRGSMVPGSMGQSSLGPGSMGRGSMGQGSMGQGSMGQSSMGRSLGQGSMGQGSMVPGSMGQGSMVPGSMGQGSMGCHGAMGQSSMGYGSMGPGSMGQSLMSQGAMGQDSMGQGTMGTANRNVGCAPRMDASQGMPAGEMQAMDGSMQMYWPSLYPSGDFPIMGMMMPQATMPQMPFLYMICPPNGSGSCPSSVFYYNWPTSSTGLCPDCPDREPVSMREGTCGQRAIANHPATCRESYENLTAGKASPGCPTARGHGDGRDPREGPCECDPSDDDPRDIPEDPCVCDPELDLQLQTVFESEAEPCFESEPNSTIDSRPGSERMRLGNANRSCSSVNLAPRCLDKCEPSSVYFCRSGARGEGVVECHPGPCPPPGVNLCGKCQQTRGAAGGMRMTGAGMGMSMGRAVRAAASRSPPARTAAYKKTCPKMRRSVSPTAARGMSTCGHTSCPSAPDPPPRCPRPPRPQICPKAQLPCGDQMPQPQCPTRPVSECKDTESMRLRLGDLSPGEDIVYHLHCRTADDNVRRPFVTKVIPCDDPLAYALNDAAREVADYRRRVSESTETTPKCPLTPVSTSLCEMVARSGQCSMPNTSDCGMGGGVQGDIPGGVVGGGGGGVTGDACCPTCCPNTDELCHVIRAVAMGGMTMGPPYVGRQRGGGGGEGPVNLAVNTSRGALRVGVSSGSCGATRENVGRNVGGVGNGGSKTNAAGSGVDRRPAAAPSFSERNVAPGRKVAAARRPAPVSPSRSLCCQCSKSKGVPTNIRKAKPECCTCRNGPPKPTVPDVAEVLEEGRRGATSDCAADALKSYLQQDEQASMSVASQYELPPHRRPATHNAAADAVKHMIQTSMPTTVVQVDSEPSTPSRRTSNPAFSKTDAERPDHEMTCYAACCPCAGAVATGVRCVCPVEDKCCACEQRQEPSSAETESVQTCSEGKNEKTLNAAAQGSCVSLREGAKVGQRDAEGEREDA